MDRPPSSTRGVSLRLTAWTIAFLALAGPLRAELQFDVFVGFDDRVREGHWFPVAFEMRNDGPPLTATVVVGPDGAIAAQQRAFAVELPTGTRKRVVIPVFPATGRYGRWEARLLAPDGAVLAERNGLQPRDTAPHVPLLGALPRTFGGLPTLPEIKNRAPEFQPGVVRLQGEYLPSNPIALEGLTACYLSSERAADLGADQADALLAWLHSGGHLIVGIEQPGDVNASPWLRALLPFLPSGMANRRVEAGFDPWLAGGRGALPPPDPVPTLPPRPRQRPPRRPANPAAPEAAPRDPFADLQPQASFNTAEMPIVTGRVLDGTPVLSLGEAPIIISAPRGRGTVTVLAFSPEREPFRGWSNRSWFWAKLIAVPLDLLQEGDTVRWGGTSIDGFFGAMLDSRQVRKLPVGALLLLLLVYLGVIGPFDQWILRRTGRQMWTWVTFPLYVVVFSGLIYFIGYRLRAGQLEWNELQVVDQLPRREAAALRGRTWVSIYSPANARYRIASELSFATFRGEVQQGASGRGEPGRLSLRLPPRGFEAEAFVPVWVNQLYASDWLDAGPPLLEGGLVPGPDGPALDLRNPSTLRFTEVKVLYAGRIHDLGELAPGQRLQRTLAAAEGQAVDTLVASIPGVLSTIRQRRYAFGSEGSGRLDRSLHQVMLASLAERAVGSAFDPGESFSSPSGFDVNPLLLRGDAVVFAWAPGQAVAAPIHRFSPVHLRRDTVVRLALPSAPRADPLHE